MSFRSHLSLCGALVAGAIAAFGCSGSDEPSTRQLASDTPSDTPCSDCYAEWEACQVAITSSDEWGEEQEQALAQCDAAVNACLEPHLPPWITECSHCYDEANDCYEAGAGEDDIAVCDEHLAACLTTCPAPPPDPCEHCYVGLDECQQNGGDFDTCEAEFNECWDAGCAVAISDCR